MDDREIKNCFDDLERVWDRVRDRKTADNGHTSDMRTLIVREHENLLMLRLLAAKCGGRHGGLANLEEESERRLKSLQTEHFIRYGDIMAVEPQRNEGRTMSALFRDAYIAAGELAEIYMLSSTEEGKNALREKYYGFSLELGRQQEKLKAMLEKML